MSEIIFLPKRDRERLSQLSQLIRPLTEDEAKEQVELNGRRKTLQTMTINECNLMRAEINEKVAKIAAMGRLEHTRSFLVMLNQLELRIDTLMRMPRQKVTETETANGTKTRKSNPLARPRRSKWSLRVGTTGSSGANPK